MSDTILSASAVSGAALRVIALGREFTASGSEPLTIGRDPSNSLVCPDPRVSRFHLFVRWHEGVWWLQDRGSPNGTFLNGQRVQEARIQGPLRVLLGDAHTGVAVDLAPAAAPVGPAAAQEAARHVDGTQLGTLAAVHGSAGRFRIGRSADNDVVLTDLAVSRSHAELTWDANQGWVLVDLGSSNGTFVNGQRIERVRVTEAELIGIGSRTFRLRQGRLEEWMPGGEVSFEALSLTARASNGTVLLDDISFSLPRRSLLAAVGPSGAGKSTLLGALTGMRQAQVGRVVYGGRDLYAQYGELRQQVGYVPQDDILHPQLTVRRALRYAAELRFGTDVSRAERERRVDEVIGELGLTERAGLQIGRLSGGQRKRVSIALELLTQPSLLFLDEPTSGLDPGMEKQVMRLLRDLADGGRTVVVVTHSVQSLDLCDRILFIAPGGRLAYFGPPDQALPYFRCVDFADVFSSLEQRRDVDWKGAFRANPVYRRYVQEPLEEWAARAPAQAPTASTGAPPSRQGRLRQLWTLTRRYLAVIASDRLNLALLLLQAPILAVIVALAVGSNGFVQTEPNAYPTASQAILFLVVCATYLGAGNAIREIVKELPIYLRERAIGLSIRSYLGSKVIVLAAVTALQAAVLVAIGASRQGGDAQGAVMALRPELVVDLAAAGLASMGMGLLVSALVGKADKALTLLPLLLVPQLVLATPELKIDQKPVLNQLGYVASARWGYDTVASSVHMNQLLYLRAAHYAPRLLPPQADPDGGDQALSQAVKAATGVAPNARWRRQPGAWGLDAGVLGALFVAELLGAAWALRRRDPNRPRR